MTVEVNEPIGGTWRMLRSSHGYTKTDAWAAQFNVNVPAEGASTLSYRVRGPRIDARRKLTAGTPRGRSDSTDYNFP